MDTEAGNGRKSSASLIQKSAPQTLKIKEQVISSFHFRITLGPIIGFRFLPVYKSNSHGYT